jgi:retron-type reverse transcriptase
MNNEKHNTSVFIRIVTLPLLFHAWKGFARGKKSRADVAEFALNLYSNLATLHDDLLNGTYVHSGYQHFKVTDPKERDIHKASVRDRVVHHLLYVALYPHFDHYFIYDSYSCRNDKGMHRALKRFTQFSYKTSQRGTRSVWILKCDIRKCFASVDHRILLVLLKRHIPDASVYALIESIVNSFSNGADGKGIPLGNLTSQLFVNVYLHELDVYIKRVLGVRRYIRYADDFVLISSRKADLENWRTLIGVFLETKLKMSLHPNKIFIRTLSSGLDFLGWVHFSDHKVPRSSTVRRMWKTIVRSSHQEATIQSYLGMLSHGNTHILQQRVRDFPTLLQ